jgi:hypothetical protein
MLNVECWMLRTFYSCPSFKCPVEIAHQSSANGSGAGSRWTWATASSISRTISPRSAASAAASAHFWRSKCSSATFRQSRPSGDVSISGQCNRRRRVRRGRKGGAGWRRPVAGRGRRGRGRRRRRQFSGTRPNPCRPPNALRRRSRRPCRRDRGRRTGASVGVE